MNNYGVKPGKLERAIVVCACIIGVGLAALSAAVETMW